MPYFQRGNARLYYDDQGQGEAILTTHGVSENGSYWGLPGVSEQLARRYRVIDTDMRAHGRSVVSGADKGYDVDTMAQDIGVLADQLGLERFHLLTHATGGMVGLRYAMDHSERLLSLMSTDTGSATLPTDEACLPQNEGKSDYGKLPGLGEALAAGFSQHDAHALLAMARSSGQGGPFLNRLNHNADPERCWQTVEAVMSAGSRHEYVAFMTDFYDDPDPQIARLKQIRCPNLVMLGEHDVMFIKPSELLVRVLPDVRHVVLEGLGHMTAIEDPQRTTAELLAFLDGLSQR